MFSPGNQAKHTRTCTKPARAYLHFLQSRKSKASLSNDIATFPASVSAINQDRSRAQTFAVASDVFLGATAVALGVAVYVTLRPHRAQTGGASVGLGLGFGEIRLQGDF